MGKRESNIVTAQLWKGTSTESQWIVNGVSMSCAVASAIIQRICDDIYLYLKEWLPLRTVCLVSMSLQPKTVCQQSITSAKCNSVRKPYINLSDTPVALASASKYFQKLPAPPRVLHNALRPCKSILTCSWKNLQWWRYIQDATRLDYYDSQILELRRPLRRSAGDLVPYSHTSGS
jgi:hypothetical protein